MKLGKAMAAFAGMLAMTVCADPCWQGQKGSGYIDDEKMWSPVPAPVYSTQTASGVRNFAQIWTSSEWARQQKIPRFR